MLSQWKFKHWNISVGDASMYNIIVQWLHLGYSMREHTPQMFCLQVELSVGHIALSITQQGVAII